MVDYKRGQSGSPTYVLLTLETSYSVNICYSLFGTINMHQHLSQDNRADPGNLEGGGAEKGGP